MDRLMTHDMTADLLGAFALDALEPFEADRVREHLTTCPRCREELAQYHHIAGMLANASGGAPDGLWDGIASRIKRPPTIQSTFPEPRPTLRGPSIGPARRRLQRWPAALGAAAAAIVVAILGIQVQHLDRRVTQVAAVAGPRNLSNAAHSALVNPQAHRTLLKSTGTDSHVAAEVVSLPTGAAYLFNRDMPALPSNQTYQLWVITDGRAVSIGLLGPRPGIVAFALDPASPNAGLTVTVEPAEGVTAPSDAPVATTVF
jgi:hypothetical protein